MSFLTKDDVVARQNGVKQGKRADEKAAAAKQRAREKLNRALSRFIKKCIKRARTNYREGREAKTNYSTHFYWVEKWQARAGISDDELLGIITCPGLKASYNDTYDSKYGKVITIELIPFP